jgi:hypothetical protein
VVGADEAGADATVAGVRVEADGSATAGDVPSEREMPATREGAQPERAVESTSDRTTSRAERMLTLRRPDVLEVIETPCRNVIPMDLPARG